MIPKNVTSENPTVVAHFDLVVGVAESAVGARVEVKEKDHVGRCKRPQWRSGKNGVGSVVGDGHVEILFGHFEHQRRVRF